MSKVANSKALGRGVRGTVKDSKCIGRECFHVDFYEHRGATLSGSRNTGEKSCCCMNNAYRGCPHPIPEFDPKLAAARKAEGWRNA